MKDSLRFVYELTADGWKRVQEGQSFEDACNIGRKLKEENPGKEYCVNSGGALREYLEKND